MNQRQLPNSSSGEALHPLWLKFADRDLEQRYRSDMFLYDQKTISVYMQFGVLVYLFLVLDDIFGDEHTLTLRLLMISIRTFACFLAFSIARLALRVRKHEHMELCTTFYFWIMSVSCVVILGFGGEELESDGVNIIVTISTAAFFILGLPSTHAFLASLVPFCSWSVELFLTTHNRHTLVAVGIIAMELVMFSLAGRRQERIRRLQFLDKTHLETMQDELRKMKDGAEEVSRAKSRFLAIISHEIRTPINGIMGCAQLLRGTCLDAVQKEYVGYIAQCSDSLLQVVNDVLDWSKVEAGKLQVEIAPFEVAQVVHDVCDFQCAQASGKGLELVTWIDPLCLDAVVLGDAGRLRQILMNLISNAIKFTPKGEILVSLDCMHEADGTEHTYVFKVEDEGIGIRPDDIPRLFQPFCQVDDSAKRRFEGTGLGLSICASLVPLFGGSISVSSEFGRGSTFTFDCKFKPSPSAIQCLRLPPNFSPRPSDPSQPTTSQNLFSHPPGYISLGMDPPAQNHWAPRILLVETHPKARTVIRKYLSYLGCVVTTCDSHDAVLALLQSMDAQGAHDVAVIDETSYRLLRSSSDTKNGRASVRNFSTTNRPCLRSDLGPATQVGTPIPTPAPTLNACSAEPGLSVIVTSMVRPKSFCSPSQHQLQRLAEASHHPSQSPTATTRSLPRNFPPSVIILLSVAFAGANHRRLHHSHVCIAKPTKLPALSSALFQLLPSSPTLHKNHCSSVSTGLSIASFMSFPDDATVASEPLSLTAKTPFFTAIPTHDAYLSVSADPTIFLGRRGSSSCVSPAIRSGTQLGEESESPKPLLCILVVDDNPVNTKVAQRMLQGAGLDAMVAGNGIEALTMCRSKPFDLVFMDCSMPVMDGYEATRAIREEERLHSAPRMPIVALSAHAFAEDIKAAYDAGMDDYLSKPFKREALLEMVKKWAGGCFTPTNVPANGSA